MLCDNYFEHLSSHWPLTCKLRSHSLISTKHLGYRPDFLIFKNPDLTGQRGIIRVDGGIHDTRYRKRYDKLQTAQFWEHNLMVFVVRNEEILGINNNNLLILAYQIKHLLDDWDKYSDYAIENRYLLGWEDPDYLKKVINRNISLYNAHASPNTA